MKIRESPMRDLLRLVVWYPGRFLLSHLPARSLFALLEIAGRLDAARRREAVKMMAKQILRVYPGAEAPAAALDYHRNHYADRLHVFLYPRLAGVRQLPDWLEFAGREKLDAAREEGGGVVLVHPHYAVPQLLPLALGILGYEVMQVGLPSDAGLSAVGKAIAFRQRQRLEAMLPATILPADRFLRPAFAWLREGRILLITGDGAGGGVRRGRFIACQVGAVRMTMPLGPARLAAKSGATLLPAIVERCSVGSYRIVIDDPVSPELDPEEATRYVARWIGERMQAAPGLWHFYEELQDRIP